MRTQRKARRIILSLVLAVSMLASTSIGLLNRTEKVYAFGTDSTVAYNPMTATKDAFKYAPTFTMQPSQTAGDNWEFLQATFEKTAAFAQTDYLAVQMQTTNYCAFTLGLLENGDRYATMVAGKPVYFMSEDGTITEKLVSGAADVAFPANEKGMLIVPISSLVWQWNNDGSDLSKAHAFYLTANSKYIWGYQVKIASVGVYRGDPSDSATVYESLLDVTAGEKKGSYYAGSQNPDALKFPSDAGKPEEVAPSFAYPYEARTGREALANGALWYGPSVGDSADNWQTISVKFDTETVDLTNAAYLVIEYNAKAGAPGLTYGLNCLDARYATCIDGNSVWGLKAGETTATKLSNVLYSAVNVAQGFEGAVIIPIENMAWQFGTAANRSLAKIDTLTITTNSKYNWAYEVIIGEVGYIDESGAYVSMLDLADDETTNAKYGKYSVTSDLEANRGSIEYKTLARKMKGDVTVDFEVKNRPAASFDVWTGGSYGEAAIVTDTYGNNAVQLKATGSNPTGDAYTAITLAGAGGWSWSGMKGVAFWARNDSDTEVSFNLEIDCKDNTINKSDRFNIKQGNRFYLYDVNTGKTTIYMTRPCATLPVGFEGWVFMPFTAFARADWSNNGVTNFMGENTVVSYLAITIHAASYQDKAFSVNSFGGYTTIPSFESVFVKAENTIPNLLDLNS